MMFFLYDLRLARRSTLYFYWLILAVIFLMGFYITFKCAAPDGENGTDGYTWGLSFIETPKKKEKEAKEIIRDSPLIFVGGVPRSGTTLMRAMLDAHPSVRCGEETHIIPKILGFRMHSEKNKREKKRLLEAGITEEVFNSAMASFITEIIVGHGKPADRLCNKDPLTLRSMEYLSKIFPNSKFVFMIRDGRATVHSIISRHVPITGFDLRSPRQCLEMWNRAIKEMYEQCLKVGPERCMMVYYEQLVLHPEKWMRALMKFLDLQWNASVLHHETFFGDQISYSLLERSTDQIIKPVNTDALTRWVGKFPKDVVGDMHKIAPMLKTLGYDPLANPPKYGSADEEVQERTQQLHKEKDVWDQKIKELMKNAPKVMRIRDEELAVEEKQLEEKEGRGHGHGRGAREKFSKKVADDYWGPSS